MPSNRRSGSPPAAGAESCCDSHSSTAQTIPSKTTFSSVRRGWLPVFGDPDGYFSTVSHVNAASAVVAALRAPAGTYNVVDNDPLTRRQLGQTIAEMVGAKTPKVPPRWIGKLFGGLGEMLGRSLRISNRASRRRLEPARGNRPRRLASRTPGRRAVSPYYTAGGHMRHIDGVTRRGFITGSIVALAPAIPILRLLRGKRREPIATEDDVDIVEFTDAGERKSIVHVPKVVKADEAWRRELSPLAYEVARERGTEAPFSGAYWNLHEKGLFRCVLRHGALRFKGEVRLWHRLAEFLASDRRGERASRQPKQRLLRQRGHLPAMRRASRRPVR